MKRIGKHVRLFAFVFTAVLAVGAGSGFGSESGVSLYAADFSTAARLGFELDQTNNLKVVPGIDLRVIGGRGLIGSKLSADYLPGNYRGYNNGTPGDIILVSSFGLLQASIFYGDLTFYTGPGTSLYVMPGTTGAFTTSSTDSLVHYLLGTAYQLYPLQVFAEIEFDIEFSPMQMGSSRVKLGVGLMQ